MFDKMQQKYLPTTAGLGMHVEARDPDDKAIMSRTYASEGRFTFTSHTAGEHIICLHSNSTAWFGGGQLRVTFSLEVGHDTDDYVEVVEREKLTQIDLKVRKLKDLTERIIAEQGFQRYPQDPYVQL
eukprot:GHVO01046686.1.p1 GENE.GHVO01046686.1~~GHVO01046686.1.p1  ORF type:complete len:127 (+),score=7.28 GHVO01046686.1:2-382(+)